MSNGQIQIPFPYTKLPPTHIKALVQKIRSNLNVTTHKKKFTRYQNCFIGNELVTWLVKSKAVPTRRDAIQICLRLFEARLIFHVKNNEIFKDDKELYHLFDPVANLDLNPNEIQVNKARAYIKNKGVPRHESGYKQLIRVLTNKGLELPEISRAICLEKYKIKATDNFPKTKINKITPQIEVIESKQNDTNNINRSNHEHDTNINININMTDLIKVSKKIIGILKYAFLAADATRSNDLDLKEFEYLLDRLGIRVSNKGAELLFRAILSQHNKRFLGFYEFKMAFCVTNPLQYIQTENDLHPAKILRKHIRKYYENVAEAHKSNRKKLAELAWGLFNHDKRENATMNLSEFKEGIKYLGLQLTHTEIGFIFHSMNKSKTGMMKKEEFTHSIKKDIPVGIGKVVDVKEILFDTFERILLDYTGTKTEFPNRLRNTSIVNKDNVIDVINTNKKPEIRKKKSIFQRMRYKSKKKKTTIKAPIKSGFGSNLAEMADTGNNMMNDIILSMLTEDDKTVNKKDDDIITAQEFKQLFSHPFYPNSIDKPVNIKQLSIVPTIGTVPTIGSEPHESDYSEMYPDIYPTNHDHIKDIDENEEEKQSTPINTHGEDGSYSPPPPTLLSVDVGNSPPIWDSSHSTDDEFDQFEHDEKISTLILPDDILNEDSDDDIPHEINIQINKTSQQSLHSYQSATSTPMTRITNMTPSVNSNSNLLDKIQGYRQLHIESKELHEDEEHGLSYYDENGSYNYKKGRDGIFAQYIGDLHQVDEIIENDSMSDDSLRQLQVQYQREQLLKGDLKQALFNDTNINMDEEIKEIHNLKPSVAKRISNDNRYDQLFDSVNAQQLVEEKLTIHNPPQMSLSDITSIKPSSKFMNLPPIEGVITLKKVICKNLARGKMKVLETYYLRVYQGECQTIETNTIATKKLYKKTNTAAKLKQLKSMKFALPETKKKGPLPTLCVIKSYPVFCKQKQDTVIWQNLPASITKDAKNLTVGIYIKREKQLVLIGSAPLCKSKKNLIPKPRIGIKHTTVNMILNVPHKFGIWKNKSSICLVYSFCPKQFNVDIKILQSTKLAIYPSKIPVCIQLIRFHLLKITQDTTMSDIEDDNYSDSESESESEFNSNRIIIKKTPCAKDINRLVGDMNSGHYKFDNIQSEVVWHGLLRWFREIKPCPVLSNENISIDFITRHTEFNDNDFTLQLIALLSEPFLSLFLWSIDFLIEMSSWYTLKLNMDNQIIDLFIPHLFGFDYARKTELFLMSPNAYSFVLRVIDLRKNQKFKLN